MCKMNMVISFAFIFIFSFSSTFINVELVFRVSVYPPHSGQDHNSDYYKADNLSDRQHVNSLLLPY
jgi:hypothetical protein